MCDVGSVDYKKCINRWVITEEIINITGRWFIHESYIRIWFVFNQILNLKLDYIYFKKPIVVEYYKSYVCYVIDNCK